MLNNLLQFGSAQQEQPDFKQRVLGGIASGLKEALEENILRGQKQKRLQSLNALGLRPEVSSLLHDLSQQDPKLFMEALKNLSPAAYQEGARPLFGKEATPLVSQTFEDEELAEERKLERQAAKKYVDSHEEQLKVASRLGKKAKDTLNFLEKHKKDLPSWPLRNINQKYNPFAKDAVRTLESLYNDLAGMAAAAEGKISGFRSGKTLVELKERAKAAINQPYETQVYLLNELIKEYEDLVKEDRLIREIQKESKHKYPSDLIEKIKLYEEGSAPENIEIKETIQAKPQQNTPKLGNVKTENGQKLAWNPKVNKWVKANW